MFAGYTGEFVKDTLIEKVAGPKNPSSTMSNLNPRPQRDYGYIGITTLVAVVVVWLLATPIVPAVRSATFRRFHLTTGSFAGWAIQQPVPSMYNFSNRYGMYKKPPQPGVEPLRYVNHFPVRPLTFADLRFVWLQAGKDRWMTAKSSYRGCTLTTKYHVARTGNGFTVKRLSSVETRP
jgi:hypothetical protein